MSCACTLPHVSTSFDVLACTSMQHPHPRPPVHVILVSVNCITLGLKSCTLRACTPGLSCSICWRLAFSLQSQVPSPTSFAVAPPPCLGHDYGCTLHLWLPLPRAYTTVLKGVLFPPCVWLGSCCSPCHITKGTRVVRVWPTMALVCVRL